MADAVPAHLDPFSAAPPTSDAALRADADRAIQKLPEWSPGAARIGGALPRDAGVAITGDQPVYGEGPSAGTSAQIDQIFGPTGAGAAPAAAPPPAPGDPSAQQALESAFGANVARSMALRERLGQLGKVRGSKRNVLAPLIKGRAAEKLLGEGAPVDFPEFEPEPFATPERIPGENDADFMERVQLEKQSHDADQALAAQEYEEQVQWQGGTPLARDVGKGEPGMIPIGEIEAERRLAERETVLKTEAAERMADAEVEAAGANRDALAEVRQAEIERQDFREQQRDAMGRLGEVEAEARKKLEEFPEFNARRRIDTMGTGQKILAMVAAGLGGWQGDRSTIDMLERDMQRDLEEQKLNREAGVQEYSAAKGAVSQGLDIYNTILDGLGGDETTADQVYLNMVKEDAIEALREEAAKTELPLLKNQYLQEANAIETDLRNKRDAVKGQVLTTPDRIATVSDPHRVERKQAEKQLERVDAHLDKLELKGVDVAGERGKQEAALEIEGVRQAGKATAARAGEEAKVELDIKKATDEWGAVETMVGDFMKQNPDNIHGVGAPLTGDQNDRIRTRNFMRALELQMTSGFTGATATDRQLEQISGMIEGDMFEMTDDAFRTRMNAIMNIASSRRRYYQDQLGSKERRVEDVSEFATAQAR